SIEASVAGRDLTTDPYRLLVHDGLGPSVPMSGVVIGFAGTQRVGYAALDDVPFVPDKVLVYRMTLAAADTVRTTSTGCVTWTANGQTHTIVSPTDEDCDGYVAASAGGDDCNDLDARIHPGATEVCGNHIDDNCNGEIDESPDADGDGVHLCDGDC